MSLVPSLLQAIVQLDGEALVMHVGDKPYVVSPTGQVDLATRGLGLDAVVGIVNQLLPVELQRALDEFGAVQYELPALAEFPGESFTIVAARGGDDVWAEVRRRRISEDDRVPMELFGPSAAAAPVEALESDLALVDEVPPTMLRPLTAVAPVASFEPAVLDDLLLPDADQLWPEDIRSPQAVEKPDDDLGLAWQVQDAPPPVAPPPQIRLKADAPDIRAVEPLAPPTIPAWLPPPAPPPPVAPVASVPVAPVPVASGFPPSPLATARPGRSAGGAEAGSRTIPPPPPAPAWLPPPAPVVPIAKSPIRPDAPAPLAEQALATLDQLLRLAAARGASTLYLSASARPSVRVDGDIQSIEGAPVLGPNDVESLLLTLMPERNAEALRTGLASEWICDVPDVGRVRCLSFRDHRGPGGVFRMMPVRAVTADQLGLTREIQSLAIEPEGLVLVAGPRSSGKRTLMSALIDLINRTRRDHVITIEREINVVHERIGSFISQREVRGGSDEMVGVARAALREDPDILVLEEVRTAALMNLALDAAGSGQLVIGGFPAHTASGAIDRIIDLYPPEYRRQVQLSIAQNLRGVVAQVLLRKTTGGRVAARELLLNTPAVASVLAEGKTSQLPLAIEGGRRQGMVPLNDALVGFVQSGAVDVREAYRRAGDRAGFLALLKRQGIDTSPIERYA